MFSGLSQVVDIRQRLDEHAGEFSPAIESLLKRILTYATLLFQGTKDTF